MAGSGVVTVLFTDLVDSTATEARLGSDRWDAVRGAHFDVLRRALAGTGGREVKTAGDGVMAVFDSALAALDCAVAMQRGTARHGPEPLGLRVGISSGEAVEEGGDWYGLAVTEAARLCATAEGGEVVVADVVRHLGRGRGSHEFGARRDLELKGIPDPVSAWTLVWDRPSIDDLPLPTALDLHRASAFVGREVERTAIEEAWQAVGEGGRRVAMLAGEPGVGKTRLASEFAGTVHAAGATVLFGRCDEGLQAPYKPFVEAFRDYARRCPADRLGAEIAGGGPRLVRLVPELSMFVHTEVSPSGDPETDRYFLFEAVDAWLGAIAHDRPALVVLDDLHWADPSTLQLLRYLSSSHLPGRLLVLGTYRDTDLTRSHPLAAVLADLRREVSVRRVLLRGLAAHEVTEMVSKWGFAEGSTEELAVAVHDETDGNPFFIGEVLRHLLETDAGVGPELGIPEGVRDVIGRRLARLPDGADDVLHVAAVEGRDFDVAVIGDCVDLARERVVDLLDAAVTGGLLAEVPGHAGGYTFSHALVRQVLYEELSTTKRALLHWKVGEAIEAGGEHRLDDLAYHLTEGAVAGDAAKAVRVAVAAADRAWQLQAFEQAQAHAERALATLDQIDLPDDVAADLRVDALAVMGRVDVALCRFARAWDTAMVAADIAIGRGDGPRLLDVTAVLGGVLRGFPDDAAYRVIEKARRLLEGHPRRLSLLAELELVVLRSEEEGHRAIRPIVDELLEEARALDDTECLVVAALTAGVVRRGSALEREAMPLWAEGYGLPAARLTMPGFRHVTFGASVQAVGDRGAFDRLRDEVLEQAAGVGGLAALTLKSWDAVELAAAGRWADSTAAFAEANRVTEELSMAEPTRAFTASTALLDRGRSRSLPEGLRGVHLRDLYQAQVVGVTLVAALADAERTDEAHHELDAFLARWHGVDGLIDGVLQPYWVRWLCEVAIRLDRRDLAEQLWPIVEPYGGLLLVPLWGQRWEGAADRSIGQLAEVLGRPDEARARYESALELEERMRAPALATRTRYWLARLLGSRELAQRVVAEAEEMDLRSVARDAARLV